MSHLLQSSKLSNKKEKQQMGCPTFYGPINRTNLQLHLSLSTHVQFSQLVPTATFVKGEMGQWATNDIIHSFSFNPFQWPMSGANLRRSSQAQQISPSFNLILFICLRSNFFHRPLFDLSGLFYLSFLNDSSHHGRSS